MKILKLSTNKSGGATIAAERQAIALRELGLQVHHLLVEQNWGTTSTELEEKGKFVYLKPNMSSFVKTDLLFQKYLENNRSKISNTYMSIWKKETSFDLVIMNYIKEKKFDIVHFHWASSLVSSRLLKLLKKNKTPVFFTGHDMNHFSGACHYYGIYEERIGVKNELANLISDPLNIIESSFDEKHKAMELCQPKFVFPSRWLNKEYQKSSVGKTLGINSSRMIHNCLDIKYFSPANVSERKKIRNDYGFENDEIIVVSGAENNHEIRKGFKYFESAVKKINLKKFGLDEQQKIKFVAFGGGVHIVECMHPNISYVHLGILSEVQVRNLFRAADLLAFTSVEENFANVILESLMCACPVLAFNVGGVPDIVRNGVNGKIVESISESQYCIALESILNKDELKKLREKTKNWRLSEAFKYSNSGIARELLQLYVSKMEEAQ